MSRKLVVCIIGAIALFLSNIVKILGMTGIIAAFKDYNFAMGLLNSPFVGLKHFREFFSSPIFPSAIINTVIISVLTLLLTFLLTYALVLSISRLKSNFVKYIAVFVIAIPFLLPVIAYISFFKVLPNVFFIEPQLARIMIIVMNTLKYLWIPVLTGVMVCNYSKNNSLKMVLYFCLIASAFQMFFMANPDIENLLLTYNPKVYETLDILGTAAYRRGLLMADINYGSVIGIIGMLLSVIFAVAGVIGIFSLRNKKQQDIETKNSYVYLIPYAIIAVLPIIMLIYTFSDFSQTNLLFENPMVIRSIIISIISGVINALLCSVFTLVLAYPLFYSKKVYPILLMLFAILSPDPVSNYLSMRSLGAINTIVPEIFTSMYNIIAVFCLYYIVSKKCNDEIPRAVKYSKLAVFPLLFIFMAVFAKSYGSFYENLLFVRDRELFKVSMIGKELLFSGDSELSASVAKTYNGIVSIIPIVSGFIIFATAGLFDRKDISHE